MEALAARGNVAEALITYQELQRVLGERVGIGPGPVTQALYRRLLQGGSGEP